MCVIITYMYDGLHNILKFLLRRNSCNIKLSINHFKVYYFLAFSTFTMLYDHHLCLVPRHLQHPKRKLCVGYFLLSESLHYATSLLWKPYMSNLF